MFIGTVITQRLGKSTLKNEKIMFKSDNLMGTKVLNEGELFEVTGAYSRDGALEAIGSGAISGADLTWETGWGVVGGISIGAAMGGIGYIIHG